jgi:hypothetical protein
MRVCYIISTCTKYLDNRVINQINSFLKHIPRNDIYYLTKFINENLRHFCFDLTDTLEYLTYEYIDINNLYDWYIFIDDTTFVFHNRLIKLLENYNSNENYYIGKILDNNISDGICYILSNSLYNLIIKLVRDNSKGSLLYWCDDLCINLYIQNIANNNLVNIINNDKFHLLKPDNIDKLSNGLTYYNIIELNQWNFFNIILEKEMTVCVVLSDKKYENKVITTIKDLRTTGEWNGTIIHINIGYNLDVKFKSINDVQEIDFPLIDKIELLKKIGKDGFKNSDKREINKLSQWEKFHVFDNYFKKWSRVIFFDAGLRIFDDISCLLKLDYKNKIVAPDDCYKSSNIFKQQLIFDNQEYINIFQNDYPNYEQIYNSNYFLNCIWIYDTKILDICNKNELIDSMNKYPICKTNEMTIMNIIFHFKYNLWIPFPIKTISKDKIKYLFEWSEIKNSGTTINDYCLLKYPVNIFSNRI